MSVNHEFQRNKTNTVDEKHYHLIIEGNTILSGRIYSYSCYNLHVVFR